MKWFKHLSGSLNNSFVFELIEKFGAEGYLVFFGTLELMADEFDVLNPGKNRLSLRKLTKNFQLSRQKTAKILKFCDQKANEKPEKRVGFFASVNGNWVDLYCPRLKDLTDEYTQKLMLKLSGQNRDKIGTKSGQTPVQRRRSKKKSNKREYKEKGFLSIFFQRFWNQYPRKVGKTSAYKKWCFLLKSEKNAVKAEELSNKILNALVAQRQHYGKQWTREGGKYCPHPATWLHNRRWEDELPQKEGGLEEWMKEEPNGEKP